LEPIPTPNEWFIDLMGVCKELGGGNLVKNISTYPNLQATLVHPETTRDFEYACQVSYVRGLTFFFISKASPVDNYFLMEHFFCSVNLL